MMESSTWPQLVHTALKGCGFVTLQHGDLAVSTAPLNLLKDPVRMEALTGFREGLAVIRVNAQSTDYMAVTHVSGQRDEFHRPFTHSHIVFVPVQAYAKLSADLRALTSHFLVSPEQVASMTNLPPVHVSLPERERFGAIDPSDVDMLRRLLPSKEEIAKLIHAILESEKCTVRLVCSPTEAIDFVINVLKVFPQGKEPLEFATFETRGELIDRCKLLVSHADAPSIVGQAAVQLTKEIVIRDEVRSLGSAIAEGHVEEISRIKGGAFLEYQMSLVAEELRRAISQQRWDAAEGLSKGLKTYLDGLSGSPEQRRLWRKYNSTSWELSLDLAAGRQDDSTVWEMLRKSVNEPKLIDFADARGHLENLLQKNAARQAFRIQLISHVLHEDKPAPWLSDAVVEAVLQTPPVELFINRGLEIPKTVRSLHKRQPAPTGDGIAKWICNFDFETELYKCAPSTTNDSGSLLQLIAIDLALIAKVCQSCARKVVLICLENIRHFLDWPAYRFNPRLKLSQFTDTKEFEAALQRSHVLEALEEQISREGWHEEAKHLKRLQNHLDLALKKRRF